MNILTLKDRCDRCGAAAKSRFLKPTFELFLCGHHSNQHSEELVNQGWIAISETANHIAIYGSLDDIQFDEEGELL